MSTYIEINVDLGEGVNNEAQLMPFISSCNIACGGHAGDEDTMRTVIRLAKVHSVKIGAHPSFPDRENFGRIPLDISCSALFLSIENQIKSLMKVLRSEHLQLHHVKPHGALYNLAAVDNKIAEMVVEVMKSIKMPLKLYVPYGSIIASLAVKNNIPITYEAFADRNYNDDLTLVSRSNSNALITEEKEMLDHILRIFNDGLVKTISGKFVEIKANTFCVHGDNPRAIDLITSLNNSLSGLGIRVL